MSKSKAPRYDPRECPNMGFVFQLTNGEIDKINRRKRIRMDEGQNKMDQFLAYVAPKSEV